MADTIELKIKEYESPKFMCATIVKMYRKVCIEKLQLEEKTKDTKK